MITQRKESIYKIPPINDVITTRMQTTDQSGFSSNTQYNAGSRQIYGPVDDITKIDLKVNLLISLGNYDNPSMLTIQQQNHYIFNILFLDVKYPTSHIKAIEYQIYDENLNSKWDVFRFRK
ncbi:hypothetical protein pb186bvf_005570 [Paramecium bursaria]